MQLEIEITSVYKNYKNLFIYPPSLLLLLLLLIVFTMKMFFNFHLFFCKFIAKQIYLDGFVFNGCDIW